MKDFLKRWLINTLAVLVAAHVISGITYDKDDWVGLLLATLVLGILNAIIKPFMVLLSLPLVIFSLGLFMVIINAVLLKVVDVLFDSFHVATFPTAILGAIVISIVSMFLNALAGTGNTRVEVRRTRRHHRNKPPGNDGPGGSGPVIDV